MRQRLVSFLQKISARVAPPEDRPPEPEEVAADIVSLVEDVVDPGASLDEPEELPNPVFLLVGQGDTYGLEQILRDFEGFGIYNTADSVTLGPGLDPTTVTPMGLISRETDMRHVRDMLREAPPGLVVSLGALHSPARYGVEAPDIFLQFIFDSAPEE